MYSYIKKELPKNTLEVEITIPFNDIKKEREIAFEKLKKNLVLPGFRQGKAPKEIAEKNISKDKIYQEAINQLLNKIFSEIVNREKLTIIGYPKIELKKAKEEENWLVIMQFPLKPKVVIKNYRDQIKKLKQEEKKVDIWVPGRENETSQNKDDKISDQKMLSKILEKLLTITTCEISDIIIEEELNKRLVQLYDDLKKIGVSVEAYLKSKNLTIDQLKNQIEKEIEETYKLEFILQAIADEEKITVEGKDLEKLFSSISNPKEKQEAKENSYFYATLLRKQKTLDFLLTL